MIIALSLLASIDVFKSGADGYNCYRIPSMITLPGGRIFAFAEGRLHDCYDGPNHKIDVVFKSSDDNGTTWSKLGVLYSDKGDSVTINNPAPAYVGGRILVVFCRQYSSLLALRSNDALGNSWPATPTDITAQVAKIPGSMASGPPGGLVIDWAGGKRVLVAMGGTAFGDEGERGRAIYSDDGGVTWNVSSTPASRNGGEAQIALAPNGSLLHNGRGETPAGGKDSGVRSQSVSDDGGVTWSAPQTTLDFGFGSSCEGSILRAGPRLLLLSHGGRVNGVASRWNMSVWSSVDSGATWSAFEQVEKNETAIPMLHTAYSTLVTLNATHAAVLYERGPLPPWHTVWGEYETIRWHVFALPSEA